MDKVFTLQGRGEEAGYRPSNQELEGCVWNQQRAFHATAILYSRSDILVGQPAASMLPYEPFATLYRNCQYWHR